MQRHFGNLKGKLGCHIHKRAWGLILLYAMRLPAIQELKCSHKTCETSVYSGNGVSKAIIKKIILEKTS